MKARFKETVFYNGSLVKAGTVIEVEGGKLPSYLEPESVPEAPAPDELMGVKIKHPKTLHDHDLGRGK